MPFLSSDLGNATEVSTYWWGCPASSAQRSCGDQYDIGPTMRYLRSALQQTFELYGGDPDRVVITGWSRGAIATGAIGLHDASSSKLFKAFIPSVPKKCTLRGVLPGDLAAFLAWTAVAQVALRG
jgi:predicted esterase